MSIWNYVVTAHKPTNVTHSCVGNFTAPHELNLIIAVSDSPWDCFPRFFGGQEISFHFAFCLFGRELGGGLVEGFGDLNLFDRKENMRE
ncbi:hypothetical protein TIFTF001_023726 [Ficus carica]|uniref:Uncharacterized protein n=1 Tax=Ficus carica TaxID=3494 RepID=A0AA88DFI3_FICCA|nr:hypothetical protein TIFTF001_023726 [Ficus carica]